MPNRSALHELPIYTQIAERLMRDIGAGRLNDGERLAPEREMAAGLGVSVGTLRKSLKLLESKGLLERVQGSGNYIRSGTRSEGLYAMFRLELPEGGGLPRARVLDVTLLEKPDDLPAFGTAARASRVRRLRYLNDVPVALEEIWLDESAGRVAEARLSESLYLYYQTVLGFWIRRAEDRVGLGVVPEWAPETQPLRAGTKAGYIERMSWAEGNEPIEHSRTWFDADRARYVQRMR